MNFKQLKSAVANSKITKSAVNVAKEEWPSVAGFTTGVVALACAVEPVTAVVSGIAVMAGGDVAAAVVEYKRQVAVDKK